MSKKSGFQPYTKPPPGIKCGFALASNLREKHPLGHQKTDYGYVLEEMPLRGASHHRFVCFVATRM
jgi:hypothetical protein